MDCNLLIEGPIVGHLVVCQMPRPNQCCDYNKPGIFFLHTSLGISVGIAKLHPHKSELPSSLSYQELLRVYLVPSSLLGLLAKNK